jgi:hypothetical protein
LRSNPHEAKYTPVSVTVAPMLITKAAGASTTQDFEGSIALSPLVLLCPVRLVSWPFISQRSWAKLVAVPQAIFKTTTAMILHLNIAENFIIACLSEIKIKLQNPIGVKLIVLKTTRQLLCYRHWERSSSYKLFKKYKLRKSGAFYQRHLPPQSRLPAAASFALKHVAVLPLVALSGRRMV